MEAPALSYATTPDTSLNARARLDTSGNFDRNGNPRFVRRNSGEKDNFSRVCTICLIRVPVLYTKPSAILIRRTEVFEPFWSLSAWLTRTSLNPSHFMRIIKSTKTGVPGKGSVHHYP